ncbi:MAG: efflux RND transporter periplasmic adaptor subunit [Muribaculaceae bacterium]|nr:efflux RND transporter periplasmic adaptor subunit [Muribaculaceae bacterium]
MLAPVMAERFGVKVNKVEAAPLGTSLRATGVVADAADGAAVVSAPVAGTVRFAAGIMPGAQLKAGATVATINTAGVAGGDSNAAAKAALDAAKRELDRLEPLHRDRLVTDDVYNAARAAFESARAAYSAGAAGGRAAAPISGAVTELLVEQGGYVEAGAAIARMSAARKLVLRVDVPERQRSRLAGVTGVNVRVPGSDDVVPLKAARIQAAPAVAAAMPGYVPGYFEIVNDGTLAPGATVDAWLTSDAGGAAVLSVPRTAIAEQQGNYYVYRRLDEDCYMKLPVKTGASDGMRVVITSGLEGGEEIVTEGVTAIRLAETAGVVPEGHSHNH